MALLDALQAIASGIPSARKTMQGFNNLQAQQQKMRQQQKINPLQLQMLQEKAKMQPQLDQSQLAERQARDQLLQHQAKAPYSTTGKEVDDIAHMSDPREQRIGLAAMQGRASKPQVAGIRSDGTPIMTQPKINSLSDIWFNKSQQPQTQQAQDDATKPEVHASPQELYNADQSDIYTPDYMRKSPGMSYKNANGDRIVVPTDSAISKTITSQKHVPRLLDSLRKLKEIAKNHPSFMLPGSSFFERGTAADYQDFLGTATESLLAAGGYPRTHAGLEGARQQLEWNSGETPSHYMKRIDNKIKNYENMERQNEELLKQGYHFHAKPTPQNKTPGQHINAMDSHIQQVNDDMKKNHHKRDGQIQIGGKNYSMEDLRYTASQNNMTIKQVEDAIKQRQS